jgi:hypothetical protein
MTMVEEGMSEAERAEAEILLPTGSLTSPKRSAESDLLRGDMIVRGGIAKASIRLRCTWCRSTRLTGTVGKVTIADT